MIALRENPRAAEAYGINAMRTMLAGFAISGFLAATAGVLFVHHQHMISQDIADNPFSAEASLRVFAIVVIGGLASVPGAILGAVYVFAMQYYMLPEWRFLATGVGLLAILLILPGGLGAGLAEARDGALRWIARRRGIIVPSLLADRRDDALDVTPSMAAAVAEAVERPEVEEVVEMQSDERAAVTGRTAPPTTGRCCSAVGKVTVHKPRGPRRYFNEITAGYAALPAASSCSASTRSTSSTAPCSACSARRSATTSASPTRAT